MPNSSGDVVGGNGNGQLALDDISRSLSPAYSCKYIVNPAASLTRPIKKGAKNVGGGGLNKQSASAADFFSRKSAANPDYECPFFLPSFFPQFCRVMDDPTEEGCKKEENEATKERPLHPSLSSEP